MLEAGNRHNLAAVEGSPVEGSLAEHWGHMPEELQEKQRSHVIINFRKKIQLWEISLHHSPYALAYIPIKFLAHTTQLLDVYSVALTD